MGAADKPRIAGIAGGLIFLVGWFCLFCAAVMLAAMGWRGWREHDIATRWIPTRAVIGNCGLKVYHPFMRRHSGGGTVYSLRCRLNYQFDSHPYEDILSTTSSRSTRARDAVAGWVARHPAGSGLMVRIDPRNPRGIAAMEELPIHQFNTAAEAAITALAFGAGGLLFLALGRRLLRPPPRSSE